jgi:hypothetical protein
MKRTVIVTTIVVFAFSFSLVVGLNEPSRGAAAYRQPVPNSALLGTTIPQSPERRIVGTSIACSDDHVYTWYEYGVVTVGNSSNLTAYQPVRHYFSRGSTDAIIGMGIAGNDHVYAWYRDGTVTSGISTYLEYYRFSYKYSLPPGKKPADVVGIDIACSDDHVYAWYRDGTVSSGTSDDLDKYSAPHTYSLPPGKTPDDIVEIGIAGNDHVYAWYRDRTVSSGTSIDLDHYRAPYSYALGCGIGASAPEHQGWKFISAWGSRGPDCGPSEGILEVNLMRHFADGSLRILAEKHGLGNNFDVQLIYNCTGQGDLPVSLEVKSKNSKVSSGTVHLKCP